MFIIVILKYPNCELYYLDMSNKLIDATNESLKQNSNDVVIKKPDKKGGPYSKIDQDKRREDVYRLHFEYNYSARKISELMNVNRNTINEDVKYWYSQLSYEVSNETIVSSILKQVYNMELQKTRLREKLDITSEFSQILAIEKLLLDIDHKLAHHITKIMSCGKELSIPVTEDIAEEDIKKLVRDLVLEDKSAKNDADVYSENEIEYELFRRTNCEQKYVNAFLEKLEVLGIKLCQQDPTLDDNSGHIDDSETYNLARFAHLRNYITDDEFAKANKKVSSIRNEKIMLQKENKKLASILPKDGRCKTC